MTTLVEMFDKHLTIVKAVLKHKLDDQDLKILSKLSRMLQDEINGCVENFVLEEALEYKSGDPSHKPQNNLYSKIAEFTASKGL